MSRQARPVVGVDRRRVDVVAGVNSTTPRRWTDLTAQHLCVYSVADVAGRRDCCHVPLMTRMNSTSVTSL